jgi:DNA polymerase-3 subunit delta'
MLLVSHSPGRLLPTIRSRCRKLILKPLDDAVVVELLRRERIDLSIEDARAIAGLAEGSLGKALALDAGGGLTLYRDLIGLLSALPRYDIPALHAFADKVAKTDEAFRVVTDLLVWWLAKAAASVARRQGGDEVVAGEAALRERLVRSAGLDRWVEVWEKTIHLIGRAEAVNLDRKQVLLNAFLALERLCRP